MNSWSDAREECLDPLLPHVAGVIESMDMATFGDIKNQVETDLERKLSDSDLIRALEAGVKLGMFNMRREFKVCREFTTKEIKKLKHMEANLMAAKSCKKIKGRKNQRTLMDYVKNEREQRKRKLSKRRQRKTMKGVQCRADLRNLCRKCKKSAGKHKCNGKKLPRNPAKKNVRQSRVARFNGTSNTSTDSNVTKYEPEKNDRSKEEETPKKSKLLIQKNSMETEPPYYDIFT